MDSNATKRIEIHDVIVNILNKFKTPLHASKLIEEVRKIRSIDKNLQPLHKALFIESNPAPVKYAAKILGLCSDEIRLPLVNIKEETKKEVDKALSIAKLLS